MIKIKPTYLSFRLPFKFIQLIHTDRDHCLFNIIKNVNNFVNPFTCCNLLTCHYFFFGNGVTFSSELTT